MDLNHPHALQVVLSKRTYVLPWNQFLYAEGGDDELRLIFTTHDVLIKGYNLYSLLAPLAAHEIARLKEPTRSDRFMSGSDGSWIREITVKKMEENCP
jgi:hypothetical protein